MDRRNFLEQLGVVVAGASIPIQATPTQAETPKTVDPDGIGFLAQEILNYRSRSAPVTPEVYQPPFATEPTRFYARAGELENPPPEPKIQPLLDDLRGGDFDRIKKVCDTLWEISRQELVEYVKGFRSSFIKHRDYRQVLFVPKRISSLVFLPPDFSSTRLCTPIFTCDLAEIDNRSLALMLGGVLEIVPAILRRLRKSEAYAFDTPFASKRPDLVPDHFFMVHTPARTAVKQEAWMTEIRHYVEMYGILTSQKITISLTKWEST